MKEQFDSLQLESGAYNIQWLVPVSMSIIAPSKSEASAIGRAGFGWALRLARWSIATREADMELGVTDVDGMNESREKCSAGDDCECMMYCRTGPHGCTA